MQEFNWNTADGVKIYAKEWEVKEPKGVVCLVHGLGEHINRYNHVAEFFNQNGYAVLGNDHRGHGQSDGKRGHAPKHEVFLDEVDQLLAIAKERYLGKPTFLYGHSMGGNIVLTYAVERQPRIAGIISSAAFIQFGTQPSKILVGLGKLTRSLYPSLTQANGLGRDALSHDPKVIEAYSNDPLVHDKISSAMGMNMMDAAAALDSYEGTISSPLLVMHGEDDRITSAAGSKAFADRVKGDVSCKIWEGLYHEIHNEPQQEYVFKHILGWMTPYC